MHLFSGIKFGDSRLDPGSSFSPVVTRVSFEVSAMRLEPHKLRQCERDILESQRRLLSPFVAVECGYIDEQVEPHETRRRVARALAMLKIESANGTKCHSKEIIAAIVIEIAQTGERDQKIIADKTVVRLRQ